MSARLIDPHGRHIKKLRLSLLDACNFRCTYCMPENQTFLHRVNLLSRTEIFDICQGLSNLGIEEIRLTGGEPTLRPDYLSIAEDLSQLPLKKLGITTNGYHLKKGLKRLAQSKCQHINISLDSLDKDTFEKIAKVDGLHRLLDSIETAQALGFKIKINTVVLRGINDLELDDFIAFSRKHNIEIRFLELMKIGHARQYFNQRHVPNSELLDRISQNHILSKIIAPVDSTSQSYDLANGATIGFISSETQPFCMGCSRLRLGADGTLRSCLMLDNGIKLKNRTLAEFPEILKFVMAQKPTGRLEEAGDNMNRIGG